MLPRLKTLGPTRSLARRVRQSGARTKETFQRHPTVLWLIRNADDSAGSLRRVQGRSQVQTRLQTGVRRQRRFVTCASQTARGRQVRRPSANLGLYSWRNASIGCTPAARRAGIQLAANATASKNQNPSAHRCRIVRLNRVEHRLHQPCQEQRRTHTQNNPSNRQPSALTQ